jgi:hypothetical protein
MKEVRKQINMLSVNQMSVYHTVMEAYDITNRTASEQLQKKLITLLTLLRILFLGRIGSISYVLRIRQNIDILNRDIRVGMKENTQKEVQQTTNCMYQKNPELNVQVSPILDPNCTIC